MAISRLMIDDDVVFYAGLLGRPRKRVLGAWTLYAPAEGALEIALGGGRTQTMRACVVPPGVAHHVRTVDERIQCVLIEPEFIDLKRLPDCFDPAQAAFAHHGWGERLASMAGQGGDVLEAALCGGPLPRRAIDARIRGVIEHIRREPGGLLTAQEAACFARLSTSRFIHLFRDECGCSFRGLRAWKRARSLLHAVDSHASLTQIAMDLGYSDSAYFSNSIRQVTGLRPRDIMAGSRSLLVEHC